MDQHGHNPPKAAYRAKNWQGFGKKISSPVWGAIGIKSRKGGGHVSFVLGRSRDSESLHMLGGNQTDELKVCLYPASVWEAFVIPASYDASGDRLPVYNKNV